MCKMSLSTSTRVILTPAQIQHVRGEAFINGIEIVRRWLARRRQLRDLAKLDDRLLDDVGLTRAEVNEELARAFGSAYGRRHLK